MYLKSFIHLISLTGCILISKEDKTVLLVKHGWMFCEAICYMSFRVSLVLVFFSPFNIAITSLGEERANLSAFRTFVRFVLV